MSTPPHLFSLSSLLRSAYSVKQTNNKREEERQKKNIQLLLVELGKMTK
jgi:hypothetical protein